MLCVAPGWLSLVSPLEPRMTLAGLEPAIFGSEDQRLIHYATGPLNSKLDVKPFLSYDTRVLRNAHCAHEGAPP